MSRAAFTTLSVVIALSGCSQSLFPGDADSVRDGSSRPDADGATALDVATTPDSMTLSDGTIDAAPRPPGAPCTDAADCASRLCHAGTHRCASDCTDADRCAPSWRCEAIDDAHRGCVCPGSIGALELCDGLDNDCDGTIDDGSDEDCPFGQSCIAGRCTCGPSLTDCSGECRDLETDAHNCGACGHYCAFRGQCTAGVCGCPADLPDQCYEGRVCANLRSDPMSCGGCGVQCPSGAPCVDGTCRCPPDRPDVCGYGCVDLQTSDSSCGDCFHSCPIHSQCVAGVCECVAPFGSRCGAFCVDASTDSANCGACGTVCSSPFVCRDGSCQCASLTPATCDGRCVSLERDAMNCGSCGSTCDVACDGAACVTAAEVSFGYSTGCARWTNGRVSCWGPGSDGAVGDGTIVGDRLVHSVSGITNATQITVGAAHACALLDDGSVRCWGGNMHGQVGDGTTSNRSTPVLVSIPERVDRIDAGSDHTCARTSSGRLFCWGANGRGQLGNGSTVDSSSPVEVLLAGSAFGASFVDAGLWSTCAVARGRAYCWGANTTGQLGDGTVLDRWHAEIPVNSAVEVAEVAIGREHACLRTTDNLVYCWGRGDGAGPAGASGIAFVPARISLSNVVQLSASLYTTSVRLADGSVWSWGVPPLGDGTTTESATPHRALGIPPAVFLSASWATGVIDATGAVWGWGSSFVLRTTTFPGVSTPIRVQF